MGLDGEDPVIFTAGKDKIMQVLNPTSSSWEQNIELPTNEVLSLSIYRVSEMYIMIGTRDNKVLVWDFRNKQLLATFTGHRACVYTVSIQSPISPTDVENGNDLQNLILVSGSADHTARTWNLKKKKKLNFFWAQSSPCICRCRDDHSSVGSRKWSSVGLSWRPLSPSECPLYVGGVPVPGHIRFRWSHSASVWPSHWGVSLFWSETLMIFSLPHALLLMTMMARCRQSSSPPLLISQWFAGIYTPSFRITILFSMMKRNGNPRPYLPALQYFAPSDSEDGVLTKEQKRCAKKRRSCLLIFPASSQVRRTKN